MKLVKEIKHHPVLAAITLYCLLVVLVLHTRPSFVFRNNGTLKEFGFGNKARTMMPFWLLSLVLAILSHFIIIAIRQRY